MSSMCPIILGMEYPRIISMFGPINHQVGIPKLIGSNQPSCWNTLGLLTVAQNNLVSPYTITSMSGLVNHQIGIPQARSTFGSSHPSGWNTPGWYANIYNRSSHPRDGIPSAQSTIGLECPESVSSHT